MTWFKSRRWTRHMKRRAKEADYSYIFTMLSPSVIVAVVAALMTARNGQITQEADRAWLGPASMRLSAVPTPHEDFELILEYQNSGRQPALDVNWYLDSHVLPGKDGLDPNRDRANDAVARCLKTPAADKLVAFPGKNDLEPKKAEKGLLQMSANEQIPIFFDGCFAYRTLGVIHHSAFCYKFDPKHFRPDPQGRPILDLCNYGHSAD